ncbi:fatty acyl- reductase 1, partial [Lasius niger]
VSVVFHLAATVRFDEDIKTSTALNVIATNVILDIAKHMPNLKSFIHVSTAYANCHVKYIEERFYTYSIGHRELITLTRTLPESTIKERIARITSLWPNTYTFTKAITEAFLKHEGEDLPIGIFRPAIVLPSAREPLVGWVDKFHGPIGLTASVFLGIARFIQCDNDILANIVPVDLTVNSLIACAWDVSNKYRYVIRHHQDANIH